MATDIIWVHGASGETMQPDRFPLGVMRLPGGAILIAGPASLPHDVYFSLCTPAKIDNKFLVLNDVIVLFNAGPFTHVTAVNVYDGVTLVKAFPDLDLQGNHTVIQPANTFAIGSHLMHRGLLVVVTLLFDKETDQPTVTIAGVGARFSRSSLPVEPVTPGGPFVT